MQVTIREPDEKNKDANEKRLKEILSHPEVAKGVVVSDTDRNALIAPHLRSLKEAYEWHIFADETLVGQIVLEWPSRSRSTYNVGYCVDYDYWGKGIATEALKQVVDYAFNVMGIHKLHGDNDSDSPASGRVMEKAGFTKEAVFSEHVFKDGKYIDIHHWVQFNESSP